MTGRLRGGVGWEVRGGGLGYGRMEGVESGWAGGGGGEEGTCVSETTARQGTISHIRRRNKDGGCQEYHATTRGALGDSEVRKNASGVITGHCFDG